jgi:signal peptidase I
MARPTRKAFPDFKTPVPSSKGAVSLPLDPTNSGVFGFLRDMGVRETIESIAVAIILAMIFRVFLAEAFIIPTGSMAPSLNGAHKEITCDDCGFTYAVGASEEFRIGRRASRVTATYCPVTQYKTNIRENESDHQTYKGDRIIVNKFIYDFKEPERYDVIVFKYPNNGKQNFIKRLIGLPGDNILIENGDIFLMHQQADGSWQREITRKPAAKLRTTLQVVDDTHHIGRGLKAVGWPSRWQQFRGPSQWSLMEIGGNPVFTTTGADENAWLRYRHFRPNKEDWENISNGNRPRRYADLNALPAGRLVVDHYAYNDVAYEHGPPINADGFHWVGDIGLEANLDIKSSSGSLIFDLVEGGIHFLCEIDVATGIATLRCADERVEFLRDNQRVERPTGLTRLKGPGKYKVMYLNADDRLYLWINDRTIDFDAAEYRRAGIVTPQYSAADPGDAEPIGIASQGVDVEVDRLKVVRDLYYTSVRSDAVNPRRAGNETSYSPFQIQEIFQKPEVWSSPLAKQMFQEKKGMTEPMFRLLRGATADKDQFLPMGDNSPQSSDARVWDGPNYVERDMLIGRAVFVYWPHMLNKPLPWFPNFRDMRFIR